MIVGIKRKFNLVVCRIELCLNFKVKIILFLWEDEVEDLRNGKNDVFYVFYFFFDYVCGYGCLVLV